MLEYAGRVLPGLCANLGMKITPDIDIDCLARRHVSYYRKTLGVQRHTLRGDHVFNAVIGGSAAENQV